MNKLVTSLAVAATLMASSAGTASAATMAAPAIKTTTGVVLSVDTKHCIVTLSNAGFYVFPKGCNLSKITTGEWVTISWTLNGTTHDASKIVAAKPMSGMMMGMPH